MQLTPYRNYLNSEDIIMFTLQQINLSEEEVGQMLNFIYEAEEHPEKDLYARFIKEDATLDQKLSMLEGLVLEAKDASGAKVQDPNKQGHLRKAVSSVVGQLTGPFGLHTG